MPCKQIIVELLKNCNRRKLDQSSRNQIIKNHGDRAEGNTLSREGCRTQQIKILEHRAGQLRRSNHCPLVKPCLPSRRIGVDLPLIFHPAATGARGSFTPNGAG